MILIVWIIGFWQLTSAVNPRALETDGHVIYPKSLTRISQDQIVVELKLQDEMLSIYLKSNKNLFSKQSLIIEYSSQKSHPYNDLSQFDSCYYSGQVNGIYNSLAALSVCNGLVRPYLAHYSIYNPLNNLCITERVHLLQKQDLFY